MTARMPSYEKNGDEIYRRSFSIIRAEADLSAIPPDLERVAVRIIHSCGMAVQRKAGLSQSLAVMQYHGQWTLSRTLSLIITPK